MTLNISRVRKLVQTALAPKPQINPAIRNSLSGIKNMGQAPHVFPSRRNKFAAQQLFLRCTTSQSMLSLSALVRSAIALKVRLLWCRYSVRSAPPDYYEISATDWWRGCHCAVLSSPYERLIRLPTIAA
jgi:hypothetical protein